MTAVGEKEWWEAGRPFARAVVASTWGSAPLPVGSVMLIGADGRVAGGVSGGCVEGDVLEVAREVLDSGEVRLLRYGVSDVDARAVGLSCGGTIEVFVERADDSLLAGAADDVAAGRPVALATVVAHPTRVGRHVVVRNEGSRGTTGSAEVDDAVAAEARRLLAAGESACVDLGPVRLLVEVHPLPPRLVVFGASEIAAALTKLGRLMGRRVTLCDARAAFTQADRFPEADEVVVDWPHRYLAGQEAAGLLDGRTAVAVLTHDPKFDVPALALALRLRQEGRLGYVGLLASRRTLSDRLARLAEEGVGPVALGFLRSPIGMDIGAKGPAEIAISIAAEIIAEGADG